jgi:uncharacterized membrane protein
MQTAEGRLFAAGLVLVCLWATSMTLLSFYYRDIPPGPLWRMVGTHLVSGRAGGISVGIHGRLPQWLIIASATCMDAMVVLIMFPMFVFSYKYYIKSRFLREMLTTSADAAKKSRKRIARLGPVGLLFFVWFPLHMTGPLVGSIIGFFIGLHPLVNVVVVITGTFLAVVSWVKLFDRLQEWTGKFSYLIPIFVITLATVLFFYFRHKHRKHRLAAEAQAKDRGATDAPQSEAGDPDERNGAGKSRQ